MRYLLLLLPTLMLPPPALAQSIDPPPAPGLPGPAAAAPAGRPPTPAEAAVATFNAERDEAPTRADRALAAPPSPGGAPGRTDTGGSVDVDRAATPTRPAGD